MQLKEIAKNVLFRPGYHKKRIKGGALKDLWFTFDLRGDTQRWRGVYEQALQNWLKQYTKTDSICIDVGAADGYFTLLMANLAGPQGRVYAFEPSSLHERININFALNKGIPLTAPEIYTQYVADTDNDQNLTIDQLVVTEQLARVDVIKIDIDGAEVQALNGMRETLKRFRPHLFIEVHSRELLGQVEQITGEFGYKMRLEHPPSYELRPIEFNSFYYSELQSR